MRTLLLMLGLILAGGAAAAEPELPDLADESASVLSPQEERMLGEDFMRRARRELDIVEDPELNDYIRTLGHKLTAHGGRPPPRMDTPVPRAVAPDSLSPATLPHPYGPQEFRFFIVNDPSINAFAVPGGFIGANTGLILAAHSEAELAAVLAHETAHITQRHIPRMIAEAKRTTLPAMAAMLAAIVLAGASGQAGEAAIALTGATLAQKELNFSRAFEQEADRIGMGILTRAGYDARAMPAFFESLLNWSKLYETNLPEFLRTHPITTRRISESRDQAERFPARAAPDNTAFFHAQAKLRAQARTSPAEIVREFKATLESGDYRNADAEHYGYALALLADQQWDMARKEIQALLQRRADYPPYRIAQAETELAAGKPAEALAIYAAALKKTPGNSALERRYAAALLKTGQAGGAYDLLKRAVREQPGDPDLHRLLATAAGEAGHKLEAHRSLAEYYYLNGDPKAAIDQLQIATRHAGDSFYAHSGLEARIKEIKDEMALYAGAKETERNR